MRRQRRPAPRGSGITGLLGTLRDIGYASSAYRLSLSGRAPDRVLRVPTELIPGDAARGNALLGNVYTFCGQVVRGADTGGRRDSPPWDQASAGPDWFAVLHGFGWLRDLRAAATDAARDRARMLVLDWLDKYSTIEPETWRPELVGQRIFAWLVQGEFLLRGADRAFSRRFFQALALQTRHLSRTVRNAADGEPRLAACKGLIMAGLCLPDNERRFGFGLKLLEEELARQILEDGGHLERSPSRHLAALRHLVELRSTLGEAGQNVPHWLGAALDRMVPILRTYRHGDGGLALFNDTIEEESWLIDLALAQAEAKGAPLANAAHTGFRRVQSGRTLMILDTGAPAPIGSHVHAGTLGFEMSVGKERLIVNCGAWRGGDRSWRQALRATAAHSTLTVDDTNSTALGENGRIGDGPSAVRSDRFDQEGASWIDTAHDGYLSPFGLRHRRRVYIAPDGNDVRGEDTLVREARRPDGGRSFAVRFHLHPQAQASVVQDGSAVLLRLPSGAGWQLRASGGAIDLNESIYAGDGATRRRTEQIAVTGPIQAETTTVKWALRSIAKS